MSKRWNPRGLPRKAVLWGAMGLGSLAMAAAPAAASSAPLPTLSIAIGKGTIAVSGATVSGAVDVRTTAAAGLKEPSAILVALKPGATVGELEAILAKKNSDPNQADAIGSIVYDGEAMAGGTTEAQTVLSPGDYVAINIEGEGQAKAKTTFTVTASPAPAALPAPAATVRSIEFGFRGPSTLRDGELVRFENEGFLVHMDVAFPVRSRRAALLAAHDLLVGRERAVFKLVSGAPVTFAGPISHGAFQQETVTAKPGWYVQACFMDTQDGRQHTALGMERVIHIVK